MNKTHLVSWMMVGMVTSVHAFELKDYKIPEITSSESQLIIELDSTNGGNNAQTSYNVDLKVQHDSRYSSFFKEIVFDFDAVIDYERAGTKDANANRSYAFGFDYDYNTYFSTIKNKYWYSAAEFEVQRLSSSDSSDDPYLKISGGVGLGRVNNVTPLASAIRIIEELVAYSVLNKIPSQVQYQAMADFIAKIEMYERKYGRISNIYQERWISDFVQVMSNNGLHIADVDQSIAIFKIRELTFEVPIIERRDGWTVQTGFGYVASNFTGQAESPTIDIAMEYAKTVGTRAQFTQTLTFGYLFNDNSNRSLQASSEYLYQLSDSLEWENLFDFRQVMINAQKAEEYELSTILSVQVHSLARVELRLARERNAVSDQLILDTPAENTFKLRGVYKLR